MKKKYLTYIPKTLQEDFIDNRVIPFIGAGFSKNAVLLDKSNIPDWNELGERIGTYIPNYVYTNAVDALSLFEAEFSRIKLVEIMAKELKINEIKPGNTHRAFCDLYFDTICTTNFDFLIEQTLNEKNIPYSTIVSEERLPINTNEKTKLIKLHGDFNHPERMIITENDYDTFIEKNKVLTTYISSLFITKTLLLIGYSLDDNDIRILWEIIGSRLGKLRIPAYVVLVQATPIEIAKFERRNIKVINIPGDKSHYPEILGDFFNEIKELINEKTPEQIVFTDEKASEELKMPKEENKLCFISAPYKRLSFLKEVLYPILRKNGISPIALDETIMPGEIIIRKIDTLINRASIVVVDVTGNDTNVIWELNNAMNQGKKVILISEQEQIETISNELREKIHFTYSLSEDNSNFVENLETYLKKLFNVKGDEEYLNEDFELIEKGEYNAAVIMAFRKLEITMSEVFSDYKGPAFSLLNLLNTNNDKNAKLLSKVKEYKKVRNAIVHTDIHVERQEAIEVVQCIDEFCKAIRDREIIIL